MTRPVAAGPRSRRGFCGRPRWAYLLFSCLGLAACDRPTVVIPTHGVERASSGSTWEDSLDEITRELTSSLLDQPEAAALRLALFGFSTPDAKPCEPGDAMVEDLTTRLFRSGVQVIERHRLDEVIREQRLSASDLLDPNAAARLGRLVGADGVVTGTISAAGTVYRLNARVVRVETASIVAVGDADVRRSELERHGGSCE